jgi:cytochrome P450
VGFTLPPTLANNATSSHRAIRKAVAGFFSPARVRDSEPMTRALIASRIVEARRILAEGSEVDLAGAVADVPAIVLLDLLGLTHVDVAALKRWSIDSLELFWGWPAPADQERLATSAAQFYGWLRERTSAARRSSVDNLFGRLLDLGLSEEQICGVAYFLLVAGHETTSQLISTAYLRLIADPVRWNAIAQDPALAAAAVAEVLAADSSVPTWRRISATCTTVSGLEIPEGAPLLLHMTGIDGPSDLAFGVGVHRCLGAALARMETRVAVQQAATSLTGLRLTEPDPPMINLLSFNAPLRVVVRQSTPGNSRRPGHRQSSTAQSA